MECGVEYTMPIDQNAIRPHTSRQKDFVWYFVIALGITGVALYSLFTGVPWDIFMRWFGLIGLTLVVFGFAISESRSLWNRRSFWIVISSIFIVHCSICIRLVMSKVNLSGYKLMIACIVELCFLSILRATVYRDAK
jgi:hypothetical protein